MANPKPEKKDPTHWGVKDSAAAPQEHRTHTPVVGVDYELNSAEFKNMPEAHARKFLCDETFIVQDETGQLVPPLDASAMLKAGADIPSLDIDQTIATYQELTDAALLARAAQRAGGEDFTGESHRESVIDFLIGRARQHLSSHESALEGEDTEEMAGEDVDEMLGS